MLRQRSGHAFRRGHPERGQLRVLQHNTRRRLARPDLGQEPLHVRLGVHATDGLRHHPARVAHAVEPVVRLLHKGPQRAHDRFQLVRGGDLHLVQQLRHALPAQHFERAHALERLRALLLGARQLAGRLRVFLVQDLQLGLLGEEAGGGDTVELLLGLQGGPGGVRGVLCLGVDGSGARVQIGKGYALQV